MSHALVPQAPDAAAFAPYGTFVTPPADFGERAFYSDRLGGGGAGAAPVLHVNRVRALSLPHAIDTVERHPHADQVFLPLDVARYLVVVMPSDASGDPAPDRALAFEVPGTLGVVFRTGAWHAGAAVFDRPGSFAVLMWRSGDGDDEFRRIDPLTIDGRPDRPTATLTSEDQT